MGVYVKGMGIPKNCYHCPMHDHDDTGIMCVYLGRLTENRPIDCPLIEIVECKDCKWAKKEGDEGEGNLTCACHIPRFIVPSDGFCYLGERRTE